FERLHGAGRLTVPDDDAARILYDLTQEICEARGLPAYEISNHARPGAESRHNLVYWRYGEYAGIGPGAHGRLVTGNARIATATEKHPEAWLERAEREGHGIVEEEILTATAEGDEFLLMGLRLKEGIDPRRFEAFTGRTINERRARILEEEGLITRQGDQRLSVTRQGFPVLNSVIAELAA
ncbi:MAG: coproporphyrinogen III oxidase, partial [Microvirga sp.]